MNWFRVTLSLSGPTATPWQADTVFGHLCWALRHRQGTSALQEFLEPFRAGQPPILLSSGFLKGLLPRPLAPSGLPASVVGGELERMHGLRKQEYLTARDFVRSLRGKPFWPQRVKDHVPIRVIARKQVNRLTGTTEEEGRLFGFVEHWITCVVLYLKVGNGYETLARELFATLADTGYGKRKSAGYGAVRNPFKRPVLVLTEGSAFYDASPREWYGRIVSGVSDTHREVVHYGYALPVPMRMPTLDGGRG